MICIYFRSASSLRSLRKLSFMTISRNPLKPLRSPVNSRFPCLLSTANTHFISTHGLLRAYPGRIYIPEASPNGERAHICSTPSPPHYFPLIYSDFPSVKRPNCLSFLDIENPKIPRLSQQMPKTRHFSEHIKITDNKKRKCLNLGISRMI